MVLLIKKTIAFFVNNYRYWLKGKVIVHSTKYAPAELVRYVKTKRGAVAQIVFSNRQAQGGKIPTTSILQQDITLLVYEPCRLKKTWCRYWGVKPKRKVYKVKK